MSRWTRQNVLRFLSILLLGQLVSLNLATSSFIVSLIANLGVDIPLTQCLCFYFTIALVYTPILVYRGQKLKVSWYWYALLGFIDVQGSYLVVKAYQFTSITSVALLYCWTIPWALILTWIFIGTRYTLWQFLSAAFCVLSLCLVFLSDAGVGGSSGSVKPLLGDFLVIGGTLFYSMSNVGEEFCVKMRDRVEVVSMLACFAVISSLCEIAIFERADLKAVKWSTELILLLVSIGLVGFLYYSTVPFVLKMGGSAMFNLSLLTTNMWAVVIRIFFYRQQVDWLYYLSFMLVGVGIVIYSLTDKNDSTSTNINEDNIIQYQVLNAEDEIPEVVTDRLTLFSPCPPQNKEHIKESSSSSLL